MTKKKLTPEDFYSRAKANEGEKLPLSLPDGTPTQEFIIVRGVDSDEFLAAEQKGNYNLLMQMQRERQQQEIDKDFKPDQEFRKENKIALIASLVAGWSFDMECTDENVRQLFREAPSLMAEVDRLAADRKRFFKNPSVISTDTPKPSSD